MDLLAASYKHIGPLQGDVVTINFKKGTYLITAPIGSGKSFLFFDGPVFALYKWSARPMLNRSHKSGYVQLLFHHADQYWLVERTLKPTKVGGESVTSKLFMLSEPPTLPDQLITTGGDLLSRCVTGLEEVTFTNQTELDTSLKDLLPPREVTLSVHFLMQDALNVFELTPADRITVFKHLFGLLGIDDAKQRLADKRKELQTTIRIKGDATDATRKLQHYVSTILQQIDQVDLAGLPDDVMKLFSTIAEDEFVHDLRLIGENLQIGEFPLVGAWQANIEQVRSLATQHADRLRASKLAALQLVEQQHTLTQKYRTHESALEEKQREQAELKKLLESSLGRSGFDQINEASEQLDAQETQIEQQWRNDAWKQHTEITTLEQAIAYIAGLRERGKDLKHTSERLQQQQDSTKKEYEQLQQRVEYLRAQLHELDQDYAQQTAFHCDKIEGDCPYVELIKGASLKTIATQKARIEEELATTTNRLEVSTSDQELLDQQQQIATQIGELRTELDALDRQQVVTSADAYKQLNQQRKELELQRRKLDEKREQHEQARTRVASIDAEITTTRGFMQELEAQRTALDQSIAATKQEETSQQLSGLEEFIRSLDAVGDHYRRLSELVEERKIQAQQIKQLKEQELMLKDLSHVFSKELLLVVLRDFLPQLQEVINANLSQVVDYELRLTLPEDTDEKMELQIEVHDLKGIRQVKSLSGGQKAVLKIAWILAVSVLMRSNFLFLDETINSLDRETVGRVADLLAGFVKMHDMKFYVVTHAPQIQEMDIWDEHVHLDTLLAN